MTIGPSATVASRDASYRIEDAAAGAAPAPSFSVVVEWDNARLSEIDRAQRMLRQLYHQIGQLAPKPNRPPEVLIIYDSCEVDPTIVGTAIDRAGLPDTDLVQRRVIAAEGLAYYQQKNFGFDLTDREIVVFLDSDVIPEAGWLDGILEALGNPDIDVVSGNTYLSLESFYEKAFALFWFFPLRSHIPELKKADGFFANNVAFRRDVFSESRFPELPAFRGQCVVLAKHLRERGRAIYRQERSRVEHPSPNGAAHFIWRALCDGHDEVVLAEHFGRSRLDGTVFGSTKRFAWHLVNSARRVVRSRKAVGLSATQAVIAYGLAISYYALKLGGELISHVSPGIIRRHARL